MIDCCFLLLHQSPVELGDGNGNNKQYLFLAFWRSFTVILFDTVKNKNMTSLL